MNKSRSSLHPIPVQRGAYLCMPLLKHMLNYAAIDGTSLRCQKQKGGRRTSLTVRVFRCHGANGRAVTACLDRRTRIRQMLSRSHTSFSEHATVPPSRAAYAPTAKPRTLSCDGIRGLPLGDHECLHGHPFLTADLPFSRSKVHHFTRTGPVYSTFAKAGFCRNFNAGTSSFILTYGL